MKEISLNILDVAQNSLRANATEINILVFFDTAADRLTVSIKDNGCGMSQEFVSRVLDPFTTTRTTRRVGLGLPLRLALGAASGTPAARITARATG